MKLIETKNCNYLYDPNSNSIVKIENLSSEEIIKNLESLKKELLENDVFLETRRTMFNQIELSDLEDKLANNLEHLILNVTNQCNLRCRYCAYSGNYKNRRNHSYEIMSQKTAFAALDFFLKRTSRSENLYIGFYGGEPLKELSLIKNIIDRVNTVYQHLHSKIQYSLTTNGILLTPKTIEYLTKNNFKVSISLDGPQDIHDKYRKKINGQPSFDTIISNLEFWEKYSPEYYRKNVRFEATITPQYQLLKINEFFNTSPLTKENFTRFNFVNLTDDIEDGIFICKNEEMKRNLEECKNTLARNIVEGNLSPILPLFRLWAPYLKRIHNRERINSSSLLNLNGICTPGVHRLFVNCQGELKLCEKLDHFLSIGDIENGFSYETIGYRITTYTNDIKRNCSDCWAKYFCNLCFTCVVGKEGINLEKKSKFCSSLKTRLEFVLQLYLEVLERNSKAFDNISSMNE